MKYERRRLFSSLLSLLGKGDGKQVNTKDRVKCQLTVFFLLKPDDAASVDISNPCNTATDATGLFCCGYNLNSSGENISKLWRPSGWIRIIILFT